MHYGELKKCDIANGEGVRVSLFVSGCRNHCKDCFQPETWDFCYGRPFTEETEREIYAELDKPYVAVCHSWAETPLNRKTSGHCCPCCAASGKNTRKKHLVLHRLSAGGAADSRCAPPLRGYGGNALLYRHSHRRAVYTGGKGYFPAVPRRRNQRVIDMNRTRQSGKITPWDKLRK